jgi:hypothetical protein
MGREGEGGEVINTPIVIKAQEYDSGFNIKIEIR